MLAAVFCFVLLEGWLSQAGIHAEGCPSQAWAQWGGSEDGAVLPPPAGDLPVAIVPICPSGQFNLSVSFKNTFLMLPLESSEIHQTSSSIKFAPRPKFYFSTQITANF